MGYRYKQVVLVRTDINMSKGKLAVQVAHASVSALMEALKYKKEWVEEWLEEGQKKVVLKVSNLRELMSFYEEARKFGLPASLITDAGLTELPEGTITAVGIGPAPEELVDKITGSLKLL
ncbi:MAG: peptidyl-tRNA hydrolase Pth2 [Zestosphaera sp.]